MDPFDPTLFHELLRTRQLGRNSIFEPSVGSTLDIARDAARHGAPDGTLALADEQTAGRGRLGRNWVAPPRANLLPTLLLRPNDAALRQLPMTAPLAVAQALQEVCSIAATIKWPNDVQVGGRKIAGVLIERHDDAQGAPVALVGVGINVNFDARMHPEIAGIATSVQAELGRETSREELLAAYLQRFELLYDAATAGTSLLPEWRALLTTLGRQITATWPGGTVSGIAEDVTEEGTLIVRASDGARVTVDAGDVTLRS